MIEKILLIKAKEYIEKCIIASDAEFGLCRDLKELRLDNKMPEIYNEICKFLEKKEFIGWYGGSDKYIGFFKTEYDSRHYDRAYILLIDLLYEFEGKKIKITVEEMK